VWRDWYVTEAGGKGIHKLCLISDGYSTAKERLRAYLEDVEKERREARGAGVGQSDAPYTSAHHRAEFRQFKEATKQAATFEFSQKNLQRFVDWYGHLEARKLQFSHSAEYISKLRKLELANTTVNHHIRSAKSVLNYAVEAERLAKNPWRKVPELPEWERKRVVTDEEFEKPFKACDKCIRYRSPVSREDNAQTMRDILCTLRFTAMRPGELRKLRWDHIRWDDDLIVIPASEQKTGTTAKVPEDRIIPMLDEGKAI